MLWGVWKNCFIWLDFHLAFCLWHLIWNFVIFKMMLGVMVLWTSCLIFEDNILGNTCVMIPYCRRETNRFAFAVKWKNARELCWSLSISGNHTTMERLKSQLQEYVVFHAPQILTLLTFPFSNELCTILFVALSIHGAC